MIKIILEYNPMFGKGSPYGVRVIATDPELGKLSDAVFSAADFERLSKNKFNALIKTLEHNINNCIQNYYGDI